MLFPRSSGILLHPTSLPGRYGIGDLGEWAYRFVDYLADAGQSIWQVLPLSPTSYGDSPYQALSSFAGNPLLISLDKLIEIGWLSEDDLIHAPEFSDYRVDYGSVIIYHDHVLKVARKKFQAFGSSEHQAAFKRWCDENAGWLEDFVTFATLKDSHGGQSWVNWPEGEALKDSTAIAAARAQHAERIEDHRFRQWVFFTQWQELRAYTNGKGIRLVGDIPIFVAHDSSDVWANPDFFNLDGKGNPTVIAGVPPDYFSPTGQRWGNPLYRWDVLAKDHYAWWINRFRACLSSVDIIRIDHFRGFDEYWEVPASEETAVNGRWVPGPGAEFFKALRDAFGTLPIIAEDLGLMTPGVASLRDNFNLPGMKVLQFAFVEPCGGDPFLPHHHIPNCVVYTGTHDNNTTLGWWQSGEVGEDGRKCLARYIGHEVTRPHWELIRLGMSSVAHTFVVPLQDVLGFGADTRMNTPGQPSGNWTWRFTPEWLDHPSHDRLARLTKLYSRWPDSPKTPASTTDQD